MSVPDVDIIICDNDGNEIRKLGAIPSEFILQLFDSDYIETFWGRTLLDESTIVEIFNKVDKSWMWSADKRQALGALSICLLQALAAQSPGTSVMLEGY